MAPIGRDFIRAILRCASDEARLQFGEPVVIKKLDSAAPGDPAAGVSPTYTFIKTRSLGIIKTLAQRDIMNVGGLYQVGDIASEVSTICRE